MDMYQKKDLGTIVKCKRMSWLGHVHRMQSNRFPKRAMEEKLEGRRNRGRPLTRWLEDVEDDLQIIGVRRWRKEAKDRRTRSGICKAASRAVVLRSQSVSQSVKKHYAGTGKLGCKTCSQSEW